MNLTEYKILKQRLLVAGYEEEIAWAQNMKPCKGSHDFFCEFAWVVLNSGMKEQIARKIWGKVRPAVLGGSSAGTVFGHKGKSAAIDKVYADRVDLFAQYLGAKDKLDFLESLPWIGGITKFHLAKNLGMDVCKPDRHLVRIAGKVKMTAEQLCDKLAKESGDRIATVDMVIWRAANLGWV